MEYLKKVPTGMTSQMRHDWKYIYWFKDAAKQQVSWDEWNELVELYKKKGHEVAEQRGCKTVRALWSKNRSYRFDDDRKDPTLYVSEIIGGEQVFSVYFTYLDGEKANRPKGAGSAGFNLISKLFLEYEGLTIAEAFGEIENKDGTTPFDKCVNSVKYAIYLRDLVKGQKLSNLYKADISSAWPSAICDDLPDLRNSKIEHGRVAPNKDFPIAYYLRSGHIAEFGKYDTHDWKKNYWYQLIEHQSKQNFKPREGHKTWETFAAIADEDEITVLVPHSKYNLRRPIEEMYAKKEDKTDIQLSKWYKAMMNSFIGFMRSNEWNRQRYMGHISALAYARATNRMLVMADILSKEGNTPIYFAIDSIIWVGKSSKLVQPKRLGAFVLEAAGADGIIVNHGQYYLEKDGKKLLERHQGIPEGIYSEKEIDNLDDYIREMNQGTQEKVVYDKDSHNFVIRRTLNI